MYYIYIIYIHVCACVNVDACLPWNVYIVHVKEVRRQLSEIGSCVPHFSCIFSCTAYARLAGPTSSHFPVLISQLMVRSGRWRLAYLFRLVLEIATVSQGFRVTLSASSLASLVHVFLIMSKCFFIFYIFYFAF